MLLAAGPPHTRSHIGEDHGYESISCEDFQALGQRFS